MKQMVQRLTVSAIFLCTVGTMGAWGAEVRPDAERSASSGGVASPMQTISLNFQNIDIKALLQVFADFTGLNLVPTDSVSGPVTVRLSEVPWQQALSIVLQSKGLGTCARQLVKEMAGIKSVDVVVPVRRAEITTELRLRVVTTPEPATAQLLAHLGLRLPKGTRVPAVLAALEDQYRRAASKLSNSRMTLR